MEIKEHEIAVKVKGADKPLVVSVANFAKNSADYEAIDTEDAESKLSAYEVRTGRTNSKHQVETQGNIANSEDAEKAKEAKQNELDSKAKTDKAKQAEIDKTNKAAMKKQADADIKDKQKKEGYANKST